MTHYEHHSIALSLLAQVASLKRAGKLEEAADVMVVAKQQSALALFELRRSGR